MDKRTLSSPANRLATMQAPQNAQACRHLQLSRRGLGACGRDKGKETASDRRAGRPDQTSAATYGFNHEPSARARVLVPTCPTSFTLGSLICRRGQARGHDCPPSSPLHPPHPRPSPPFLLHVLLPKRPTTFVSAWLRCWIRLQNL